MKHIVGYIVLAVVAIWIGARYGSRIPFIGTGGGQ